MNREDQIKELWKVRHSDEEIADMRECINSIYLKSRIEMKVINGMGASISGTRITKRKGFICARSMPIQKTRQLNYGAAW